MFQCKTKKMFQCKCDGEMRVNTSLQLLPALNLLWKFCFYKNEKLLALNLYLNQLLKNKLKLPNDALVHYGSCVSLRWWFSVVGCLTCQGQHVWCRCGAVRRWGDLLVWSGSLDLLPALVTWPCPSPFPPVAMTTEGAAGCQKTACGLCKTLRRGCCLWKLVRQKLPCSPEGRKPKIKIIMG